MADLREDKTDTHTINSGRLNVDGGHEVYFEQWGNKDAKIPIIFFHGGPGYSYKAKHKQPFDPLKDQVIFFDQRGLGNSLPYGKTENNTTFDLVADSKRILDHLGFKKAYVFGGSWGAALALLFNIQYPGKVAASIINGVFTASKREINYLYEGRERLFYPEVWERFVGSVPASHKDDPVTYHLDIILNNTEKEKIARSAKALEDHDMPVLEFDWPGYTDSQQQAADFDYIPPRILAHYMDNNYFMDTDFIVNNAAKITQPLYIVQGRYDMACTPITAYTIHKSVQGSKLYMTLGSHSSSDPQNRSVIKALVQTIFI